MKDNASADKDACSYGLFSYDTENLGDEIQSIAVRRFLPQVDYYFNRDDIDATITPDNKPIKLIMNGWYTHKPENWPPKNPNILPLLTSIHVDQSAGRRSMDAFLSEESRQFLSKFGPVGARDVATRESFKKNDIPSYLSYCATLTLLPDKSVKKRDFILVVDVPDKVFQVIKARTSRTVLRLDTYRMLDLTTEERFAVSEFFLSLYQSAHCVITKRLHSMLPCLALGTSVLAISDPSRDPGRYSGLIDLTNHLTEEEFINHPEKFDLENPPKNSTKYLEYAEGLAKEFSDFTGYDSRKSYLYGKNYAELVSSDNFVTAIAKCIPATYSVVLNELEKAKYDDLLAQNRALESKLASLNAEIRELKEPGVKTSLKNVRHATGRYIKKKINRK